MTLRIHSKRQFLPALGAGLLTVGFGLYAAVGYAEPSTAESGVASAPVMAQAVTATQDAVIATPQGQEIPLISEELVQPVPEEPEAQPDAIAQGDVPYSAADMTCLAKIVHHESANQREHVQLAVANVVLNRVKSQRFPSTICSVALQRNQFFNVHAYDPSGDSRWATSQRIAREAALGAGQEHAPGAYFFITVGHPSAFFRSRPHVARLGDLDFHS